MTHALQGFEGSSLLIVMPLPVLVIIIIHFGNPGEIAVIVDNIHFRGRLDGKNPSMILLPWSAYRQAVVLAQKRRLAR